MKPFVLIAAAALLLAGCQSKKEICANWYAADQANIDDLKQQRKDARQVHGKLGIKHRVKEDYEAWIQVASYCSYYKS